MQPVAGLESLGLQYKLWELFMYLKSHEVKNLKQHQEEEAEAAASLCLGNFHSVGLQSHIPFHCLHWLPTACLSAHLPWMKEGEVLVICSSHAVAASTLPPSPFQSLALRQKTHNTTGDINMPKWNADPLSFMRIFAECQEVSIESLTPLVGRLCCTCTWPGQYVPTSHQTPFLGIFLARGSVLCAGVCGGVSVTTPWVEPVPGGPCVWRDHGAGVSVR